MSQSRMPALFIGHGSPMNALADNRYTHAWQAIAAAIPRPEAIVAVSAHWYTRGTAITAMSQPKTIHDFSGFPQPLFDLDYPAPGSPALAEKVQAMLAPTSVYLDRGEWGLDHGTWEILVKMYPRADIPVVQLSIDGTRPAVDHYLLGKRLAALRDDGVLIIASGNVVHNLRAVVWNERAEPFDWAERFSQFVKAHLTDSAAGISHPLVNFTDHADAKLACPTPEHYLPLLYALGTWDGNEPISTPVNGIEMGSLEMMSVQVGA